jgi:hypothetical protein
VCVFGGVSRAVVRGRLLFFFFLPSSASVVALVSASFVGSPGAGLVAPLGRGEGDFSCFLRVGDEFV